MRTELHYYPVTFFWLADDFKMVFKTVGTVHTSIKAIFKENVLHDCEVRKYVRLENGNGADVYNLEIVTVLAFRLNTYVRTG